MKQHITIDDLNSLSDLGKQRLREWWKPQEGDWFSGYLNGEETLCTPHSDGYGSEIISVLEYKKKYLPLLSIGQLIEFLGEGIISIEKTDVSCSEQDCKYCGGVPTEGYRVTIRNGSKYMIHPRIELCDSLWAAALEVLEREE